MIKAYVKATHRATGNEFAYQDMYIAVDRRSLDNYVLQQAKDCPDLKFEFTKIEEVGAVHFIGNNKDEQ